MVGDMRSMTATRALALLALAFAMLSRAIIPAGWMPANTTGYAVILCTGHGAVQMWMDDKGELHSNAPAEEAASDHPCAFANPGLPILPSLALIPALLLALTGHIPGDSGEVAIGRGLAAPPPPSTGPPSHP